MRQRRHSRARQAFTLIEMLAVLGIVAMMLLITAMAFPDIGRGAGARAAVLNIRTSLSLTRQRAITERKKMRFQYDNAVNVAGRSTGRYVILDPAGKAVTETNYLTEGTYFDKTGNVTFKHDGSCEGGTTAINIVIKEDRKGASALSVTTTVQPLTGAIKTGSWVED